jgi:hypothetical protein
MHQKTKDYMENLLWEIEVNNNTVEDINKDNKKALRKLKVFYDKVIKNKD